MAEEIIETKRYKCERCGHTWVPRRAARPVVCPSKACKSVYWDRPRQSPADATRHNPAQPGTSRHPVQDEFDRLMAANPEADKEIMWRQAEILVRRHRVEEAPAAPKKSLEELMDSGLVRKGI